MAQRLLAWVDNQPVSWILIVCVWAVTLISIVDVLTGPQYFMTAVYLIPVSLAAWRTDWQRAGIVALLSISGLLIADIIDPLDGVSTSAMLWNQATRFAAIIIIVLLITGLRESRRHAERMARTDVLTGIANLFAFREASVREIERSRRIGRPLTLLFLDIDDFKIVNDFHGHSTGDEVLRQIAETLCHATRSDDFVARVGGDEFVVLMPSTDALQAEAVIERVQRQLATITRPDGSPLTCSIGAATRDPRSSSINALLREADEAMYFAKARREHIGGRQTGGSPRPLRLLTPLRDSHDDSTVAGLDF